ncbi:MAG: DNA polymerase III subunit delta [Mycoplasma sp.]|nr:DNA polymerase III subunit delta [Mycoplasma sp.]
MFLIYGNEPFLINNTLNKMLRKKSDIEPVYFDETSILEEIIIEITTVSMFSDEKLIVVKNEDFFNDSKHNVKKLLKVLENISDDITIIFVYNGVPKVASTLRKFLFKNAEIKKFDSPKLFELTGIIKDIVRNNNGTITNDGIKKIIDHLPNNLSIIVQEIKKLLIENRAISEEQIENSISRYSKDNLFALSNAIISNNKKEILINYLSKINNFEEPLLIIGQIGSIFSLSLIVNWYKNQGLSIKQISDELQINIYRLKKTNELLMNSSINKIKNTLNEIVSLENNIKTGLIDKKIGLDYFILNLVR